MEDAVEFSGRTVDDAIAQAEAEFDVKREDLDIEIITPGSRGVFGIGAENARIRARRPARVAAQVEITSPALEEVTVAPVAPAPSAAPPPVVSPNGVDLAGEASEVLLRLLQSMGFAANVGVRSNEGPVILEVTGENLGVLIGRRGDNLAALQFMVNLILSKGRRQWPRVVVDVENYRARREESLRSLAERIAYRVQRSGKAFTLEAMPASDRRIIHLTLRDRPRVETYSIGEGVNRRVVIAPKNATRPVNRSAPYHSR